MKISYNWLKEYLPADQEFAPYINDIHKVSEILTSVGLEVEGVEPYESVPGSLEGLVVAEVLTCEKHPNADRLKVTTVNNGHEILQVVCGAPNVAAGQKVVLAVPGVTLYPVEGEPVKLKKSKIRGIESDGMLCAEDEIGIGTSREGIIVLNGDATAGQPAAEVFNIYKDYLIEIGLTPNRMDGQSHLGVAKDVCAWLTCHTGKKAVVVSPLGKEFIPDEPELSFEVTVKDPLIAPRYSGVVISGITLGPSPEWMQNRLKVLGVRPLNNVVDITNYVLHTTGQPLHSFDADKVGGHHIVVELLPQNTPFITLDEKERKLSAEDIMICDSNDTPMCIGGVFGGLESGVSSTTTHIFLESAVFNPILIRKTIIRHDLRTDASMRFEKGVDISKTVQVLQYAATLIREICGGKINSPVVDVFHQPAERIVDLKHSYLKKLSGKTFKPKEVENILTSLGFAILESDDNHIKVKAPDSNPDISLPADVVEEVLRISGFDEIEIPSRVQMTPGFDDYAAQAALAEKVSSWLTGNGFSEILTNSITNKAYLDNPKKAVNILNSLTEELTVLRTEMLPTALEVIEHNINRQNKDLLLFEFGKTYHTNGDKYTEENHLLVLCTGQVAHKSWNTQASDSNIFYVKGIAESIFALAGLQITENTGDHSTLVFHIHGAEIARAGRVPTHKMSKFGIRQPVFYLDIDWDKYKKEAVKQKVVYTPLSKFPVVTRDLSMILDKKVPYKEIQDVVTGLKIKKLSDIQMFDLYENDKLGKNKKSIAMSFSFADTHKTLTDKETDKMMGQIVKTLENKFEAEIRSHA